MKEKHKYGQYFTEAVVADFMVSLLAAPCSARVLEPSCGEGVFLEKLREHGYTNLAAYEIDETLGNAFPFVEHRSFVSSPLSETFDAVIGNPPYIRWKNLEDELKEELTVSPLWQRYFNSLCDYLFIFILKSILQLRVGGELVFICPEYWLNTTHSRPLREFMCANGHFTDIFHFKEAPLFEGVTASFIIFRYVRGETASGTIRLHEYVGRGLPSAEALQTRSCFVRTDIPQFCSGQRWLLAAADVQRELKTFEQACLRADRLLEEDMWRVGDVCDIGNGMVSGLDSAFLVPAELLPCLNAAERVALLPVFKAKALDAYSPAALSYYIYVDRPMDEDTFRREYPHFYAHLEPYMSRLAARYSYGRELPAWEFAFPRNKKLLDRPEPRILVPCKERISHKAYFRFAYAPAGIYPLQDVTALLRKPSCRESVEYLLAFLNNRRVFDWLRFNGIVKGAIVEFSEAPLASIPFRKINWADNRETGLHDRITAAVRRLLDCGAETSVAAEENPDALQIYPDGVQIYPDGVQVFADGGAVCGPGVATYGEGGRKDALLREINMCFNQLFSNAD